MSSPTSLTELHQCYLAGWAARDPDRIAALHTEDTMFWLHHGQAPVTGRHAVRDTFATLFDQLPQLGFVVHRAVFGFRHWVLDWTLTSTVGSWDCLDVVTVADDWQVARKDTYLDGVQFDRAFGGRD